MRLHREGTPTLLLALAFTCFALFAAWNWLPGWAAMSVTAVVLAVFLLIIWFFRVPMRTVPVNDLSILAPCDGRVVVIEEVHEPEHFNDRRLQVSIFMSPVNVHINWYPVGGEVVLSRYHPGKYLVAWHPKSSTENERSTVVVRHAKGEVLVRQIAGALARRIVTYAEPGGPVAQGGELGFIKFGSRVDLLLPLDTRIDIALGQRVTGASTVIARFIT